MGYILFGAGTYGHNAVVALGKENIDYFIDNNKTGISKEGIKIKLFTEVKDNIKNETIIICVSSKFQEDIITQLKNEGIKYVLLNELLLKIRKERIQNRTDYIGIYKKTINWIKENTIRNRGIIVASDRPISYPEVTGYYIPTLLRWGYRDLALSYAKWLISIQKEDGAWYDSKDKEPYIFDSAQILKGLIAIRKLLPEAEASIIKGCDWILSHMNEEGRLVPPSWNAWGEDKDFCDEIIHIYCLSPIIEAGEILDRADYKEKAQKIWKYYKETYYEKIMNFSLLSHFYAYLMEALIDLGEMRMARDAMNKLAKYQKSNGAVPGLNNVDWVCSTGLFQLALVWFRLGDIERGNKAFKYACSLQNNNGGWFGSYPSEDKTDEENIYFPHGEISWACKYFLDALYYKNYAEFNSESDTFIETISKDDDRYLKVLQTIKESGESNLKVLDVGCGKGRYIKNLISDLPNNKFFAVDLSPNVMEKIDDSRVQCMQGSLTCIPYEDDFFDCVYACEALEHAIDIGSAISEMTRVTKNGGRIIIVDKNKEKLGTLETGEWEQWFEAKELADIMKRSCEDVQVITEVNYDSKQSDGLFSVWKGTVKKC